MNGSSPTDYFYTGQRKEVEFGLSYYNARWLDSSLAHFTSADTLIPQPGDSGAWDRYAYVLNNPLKYIDPTGHYGTGYGLDGYGHDSDDGPLLDGIWSSNEVREYVDPIVYNDHIDKRNTSIQDLGSSLKDHSIANSVLEFVVVVTCEPIDWALTIEGWIHGDFHPIDVVGFLPLLPGAIRHLDIGDDIADVIKMQGHHLIPQALLKKEHPLLMLGKEGGFNIHDHLLKLPYDEAGSAMLDLPWHRGSHPQYNDKVKKILNDTWKVAKSQNWTPEEAYNFLDDLVVDLDKYIHSLSGKLK